MAPGTGINRLSRFPGDKGEGGGQVALDAVDGDASHRRPLHPLPSPLDEAPHDGAGAGRRHRVMMLTDSLDMGGVQRVVVSLSEGLARRGHSVTVVAEPGGELWAELPPSVRRIGAPPRTTPWQQMRYFTMLTRLVRSGDFDIVHAHQRAVALQARVARTMTDVRIVEHVHSLFTSDARKFLSFRGDRLVACGRGPAEMLVEEFGRPSARVTTVPNGVRDLSGGAPTPPPASTGAMPTVLVVGRVTDVKDPLRFIDVIAQLNADRQRVNAVWVGDGDLLETCVREVRRREIRGLSFVGASSDVGGYLERADLVMLTSRQEGLPLSLLEAASMGRALAAPDLGGCGDVVRNGVNGVLFDKDSPPDVIAARLAEVLDGRTLKAMGQASRQLYLAGYGIDPWLDAIEEVYRNAVDRRASRA